MRNKNLVMGFSMIEMLISMVVASIVIMGVYSFLTSSQRSFTIVQANDSANRSMQLSNRSINDYLRMAGFRNYRRVVDYVFFPTRTMKVGGQSVVFGDGYDSSVKSKTFVAIDEKHNSGKKRYDLFLRYYGSSLDDDQNYTTDNADPNNRMYDCNGEFRDNNELVVVNLYIDDNLGLMCAHSIYRTTANNLAEVGSDPDEQATVVLDPNVTVMMFSARYDGDPRFLIPEEAKKVKDNNSAKFTPDLVNAIRYGFVVAQETHQKVQHLANKLTFHLLGYDDGDDYVDENEYTKDASSNEHNIYNLVSGVAYVRNTIRENE